jgi:hypothetical protein
MKNMNSGEGKSNICCETLMKTNLGENLDHFGPHLRVLNDAILVVINIHICNVCIYFEDCMPHF